jgi:hypothetical protein
MFQQKRGLSTRARMALAREARAERRRRAEERLQRRVQAWYRLMARHRQGVVRPDDSRRGFEYGTQDEFLNWLDRRFDLTMQTIQHQARQQVALKRSAMTFAARVRAAVQTGGPFAARAGMPPAAPLFLATNRGAPQRGRPRAANRPQMAV